MFFGENEAGKSTIMSFIHSILFGFPLKTQNENRYEPKEHSAYGGKLIIQTEMHGEVIIQRIKGKATGDVTVTYSDGRVGNEDELKVLLQGIDKWTYQSIFSFDLNGLNGLQKLNENEISRYLLSAGLLGSDRLLLAEQKLQKEMDGLFKPSGRNPKINQMLSNIKSTYENVTQAAEEQDQYEELQLAYKNFIEEKEKLEKKIIKLKQDITSSYNYQTAEPLLLEVTRVQNQLEIIGEIDGLITSDDQYQQLKQALLPIDTELNSLYKQQKMIEENIQKVHIDEALLTKKDAIQRVIDKSLSLESMQIDLQNTLYRLQQVDRNIQQLKDYAHITLSEEEIIALDSSSSKKEKILSLDRKSQKLLHEKQTLDDKQEQGQLALQATEQRISFFLASLLSDEERASIQKQVDHYNDEKDAMIELKYVEESLHKIEKKIEVTKRNDNKEQKMKKMVLISAVGLLSLGAIAAMFVQQWLIFVILVVGICLSFWLNRFLQSSSLLSELLIEREELLKKQASLKMRRNESSREENQFASAQLKKDDEIRQQLYNEQMKKVENETIFYKIVDEFEQWEQESRNLHQEMNNVLKEWRIEQQPVSTSMLMNIYETITSLKKQIYEKQIMMEQHRHLQEKITSIKDAIVGYCHEMVQVITESYQEAVVLLKGKISDLDQNMLEKKQMNISRKEIIKQVTELEYQKQHLESQLLVTYNEAFCDDEADYLLKVQKSKERNELLKQLELLHIQLKPYEFELKKWNEQPNQIINEHRIRELEEEKNECDRRLNHLIQQIAECKHEIIQLEDGGTYDERSFQYFTEKSTLIVEAKEWMKYALAKSLLQKAVNTCKNSSFPELLHIAEQHMITITDGEYVRLQWINDDGGLALQRKDGIVFEAREVSRGTQEGVYVALRLALAQQAYINECMPIIIDDSFVNFDRNRVEKVISILQTLQNTHQIIFFTCHEYLLSYFNQESITKLNARNIIKN